MWTTYRQTHKSMDCPICGNGLIESEAHDEVACSIPECIFNSKQEVFKVTKIWIKDSNVTNKANVVVQIPKIIVDTWGLQDGDTLVMYLDAETKQIVMEPKRNAGSQEVVR